MRMGETANGAKYRVDENFDISQFEPSNSKICEYEEKLQFRIYSSERLKLEIADVL